MKNSEYWKKRFELLEQSQNQLGVRCYADIEKQYRQAQKQIEGQLLAWYQRFAKNNNITIQDARKILTGRELEEFKWDVKEYIRYGRENAVNGMWMEQLENASVRYHISRLEALKMQTQQALEVMFGNQLDSIDSAMRDIYTNGYYHTAFEIQKGVGVGWNFATLDEKRISKVINKPWSSDGKNFSQRIWGNRQKLVNELNTELTRNIILGQDPQKAINAIAKKMNVSKSNAGALVMTEEAFFSSAAQRDSFNELDVEQFEVVATLDSHTSDICQNMDGKHFLMSQWEVGATAPPFHVRCRTTTVPYFDDDFGSVGKRAARGEDGKTYHISADVTYKDWKKAFVDSDGEDKVDYMSNSFRPQYGKDREITMDSQKIQVKEVKNSMFNLYTDIEAGKRDKAVRLAERCFKEIKKTLPKDFQIPDIAVIDFDKHRLNANAIGGYHNETGILYINSKYNTKEKIRQFVNENKGQFANTTEYAPYLHELGHKYYYDKIKELADKKGISYTEAKRSIDKKIMYYIEQEMRYTLAERISAYADNGYLKGKITEVCAESFSVRNSNNYADRILEMLEVE